VSTRLDTWTPTANQLKRRGHTSVSGRGGLTIGEDEPSDDITGVYAGSELIRVDGNVTLSTPGQILENRDIYGRITIATSDAVVRNCRVRGTTSGNGFLITSTSTAVQRALIEDCTLIPDYPAAGGLGYGGVVGHDFTLRRTLIDRCGDSINIHNTNKSGPYNTNVVIDQNYLRGLSLMTAVNTGVVHPSDRYTHNDLIQHFSGSGTMIRGNRFDAHYARQVGHWVTTTPTEPFTSVAQGTLPDGGPWQPIPDRGNGTEATGRYDWGSIVAIQIGRQTLSGNIVCSSDLIIEDNWFYGGNFAINGGGNTKTAAFNNLGRFYRNLFDRKQGSQGSNGNTFTFGLQGGLWSASTADIPTTGPNANLYMDGGTVLVRY
jgi:hypothetical protein